MVKEIVAVYTDNHTKPFVKAGGTYSYHWALKHEVVLETLVVIQVIIELPVLTEAQSSTPRSQIAAFGSNY
jgi:hypothetical protein